MLVEYSKLNKILEKDIDQNTKKVLEYSRNYRTHKYTITVKVNKRFNNYLSSKQIQEIIDEFSISSITQNQGNGNNLQNHVNYKVLLNLELIQNYLKLSYKTNLK